MPREHTPHRARRSASRSILGAAAVTLGLLAASLMAASPAQAVGCLTREMQKYLPADLYERAGLPAAHQPGHPMAPPDNPQVGDTWNWYLWYFVGGPPHYVVTPCTVRGMGDNVYVIVEDASWNVWIDQAEVDQIVANWDSSSYGNWPNQGIYPLAIENFGTPPDELDNDPRIYVVLYNWDTSLADGYWNLGDEFPDGVGNPSNECECLYVDVSTSDPGGPAGPYLTAVMAHEFEHMIHWNYDTNESAWVDEGMAELIMWFYGNPDQISGFNSNPDDDLTTFTNYADYIKTYLWSLYFYEHFGGSPAVRALIQNQLNSTDGYTSTLAQLGYTETTAQVLRDWATANYLDDPNIEGGKYNYAGEDLPAFAATIKSTYPVPPVNTTLSHWAGEYVRFINGQPQRLNFNGGDGVLWYARAVKYVAGVPQSVENFTLDGAAAGSFDVPGFGSEYDEVVMVVVNAQATGSTSYQYSSQAVPAGVGDLIASNGLRLLDAGPNPFNGSAVLRLDLDRSVRVLAAVHDASGARVRAFPLGNLAAGSHVLRWDGRADDGTQVASGVYFLRIGTEDGAGLTRRLVRIR